MTIDERALEDEALKANRAFMHIRTEVNEAGKRQLVMEFPDHWLADASVEEIQAYLDSLSDSERREFVRKIDEIAELGADETAKRAAN